MTPLAKWTIVSICLTVLAVLVPWATYGDIDVELSRLPLWWAYLGAAVAAHASAKVAWPVSAGFAVVAVAAAVVVATGYDEASHVFGHVVPVVGPRPGPGVVFAVASAVAQVAGLRARVRAARPVTA
ncbi:hypothetical protein [Saccharothrix texasensis]|uniref:SPW repeat-containing protein n=1 Tax=Saccharothrix texasensis TaxID=103734 RepID=A0A3N1H123_9PSEU|nr:hypothetical protein [Saccharothrix texasensis]ROP36235.1 hypothetical protein EDD40_1499 [Saccharothrix texasensis]